VSPVAVFRTLGFEEKDVAVDDPQIVTGKQQINLP